MNPKRTLVAAAFDWTRGSVHNALSRDLLPYGGASVEVEAYRLTGDDAVEFLARYGLDPWAMGVVPALHRAGLAFHDEVIVSPRAVQLGDLQVVHDEVTLSTALVVLVATATEPATPPELAALSARALAEGVVSVRRVGHADS